MSVIVPVRDGARFLESSLPALAATLPETAELIVSDDGTVTFTFKRACADSAPNCLEVPAGRFDVVARYYLPRAEIVSGSWTLPKIVLVPR